METKVTLLLRGLECRPWLDFPWSAFLILAPCPDLQTTLPSTRIDLESMCAFSEGLPRNLIPAHGTQRGGLWISAV